MFVMKVDLTGAIIWNHLYTPGSTLNEARHRSWGFDLVETNTNDELGYRVVGFGTQVDSDPADDWRRPFMVQLNDEGALQWGVLQLVQANGYWTATGSVLWNTYTAIDRSVNSAGDDVYAIVGRTARGTPGSAFCQYYVEPHTTGGPVAPTWTRSISDEPTSFPLHSADMPNLTTDVAFHGSAAQQRIVWPVVRNLVTVPPDPTPHKGEGVVYLLDPAANGTVQTTRDLNEMHAFDLQLGVASLADGNLAVCGTKWPASTNSPGGYGWQDMFQEQKDCLSTNYTVDQSFWNVPSGPYNVFSFYGSQSYVAKLGGTDLGVIWEKQWQHKLDPNGGDNCYPGNVRRRQCNFKIVEADAGGLVVCGNTGHTFDDAYLAKLAPCEEVFAYTPLPLDANGEYHITLGNNETWTESKNIAGSVVVDAGATLTVSAATIGFAGSTPTLKTNVVVQPGGTLVVKNNAHLTSAPECSGTGLWDGVKILGNGTTIGAGTAYYESGGKVSNARMANRTSNDPMLDPFQGNTSTGGIVVARDAIFENNQYDLVTRPHADIDPVVWGPSSFSNCRFLRTRDLTEPLLAPGVRVALFGSANTEFVGCTFRNTTGRSTSRFGGCGIHAINTAIRVDQATASSTRSNFDGFNVGLLHCAFEPTKAAHINACDFAKNLRGAFIAGTPNAIVTNSTFAVPDVATTDLGIEGAYGAFLHGCTGFEFEQNTFTGTGTAHPKVGAIFKNSGQDDNMFYNNTFNGFADASERSVGSLIMGDNGAEAGLRIKCNDYSATGLNDFDVAFTGEDVSIAEQQGNTGDDTRAPAGNTFALVDPVTCSGNDAQHLFVQTDINTFTYWHHQPQPAVELVPSCASAPIDPGNWYFNSNWQYEKQQSCPMLISGLVDIEDDGTEAGTAHLDYVANKEVYADWSDGGDTEGLVDYVKDPAHTSIQVRNKLMLVAPKASKAAWLEVFNRLSDLNAWHVAQALLANSPLEPGVKEMLDNSTLDPFYKELVEDGQNGGVSMHSIYQSEVAHFNARKTQALQAMVRKSLLSTDPADRAATLAALDQYPGTSNDGAKLALHFATNELVQARSLVDAKVLAAGPDLGYWQVQHLLLELKEDGLSPLDLDANKIPDLHAISNADGIGAAQAQAWLELLGTSTTETVILPDKNKRRKEERKAASTSAVEAVLGVYPNPSNGPVFVVYEVPYGVEIAELLVHDAQGRLIRSAKGQSSGGVLDIPENSMVSGVHVVSLYWDGILVDSAKLEVIR